MPGPVQDRSVVETPVTSTVAAEVLGISYVQFSAVARDGWIVAESDGRYLVPAIVKGYLEYRLGSVQQAKLERDAKLSQIKIASQTLALAVKRGELVNAAAIEAHFSERVGRLIGKYDGLAARVTRDRSLRQIIQTGVDAIRNEFAAEERHEAERLRATMERRS
jgi:hypothetical protein